MSGITNPSERYFKDGHWTFDGSVWRPQNQLYAYRSVYREGLSNTNASVGTNTLNFTAVPAGTVRVIENVLAYNLTTAASNISMQISGVAGTPQIFNTAWLALLRYVQFVCEITLAAGEYPAISFYGCVAGDDIYAWCVGHDFKIAE